MSCEDVDADVYVDVASVGKDRHLRPSSASQSSTSLSSKSGAEMYTYSSLPRTPPLLRNRRTNGSTTSPTTASMQRTVSNKDRSLSCDIASSALVSKVNSLDHDHRVKELRRRSLPKSPRKQQHEIIANRSSAPMATSNRVRNNANDGRRNRVQMLVHRTMSNKYKDRSSTSSSQSIVGCTSSQRSDIETMTDEEVAGKVDLYALSFASTFDDVQEGDYGSNDCMDFSLDGVAEEENITHRDDTDQLRQQAVLRMSEDDDMLRLKHLLEETPCNEGEMKEEEEDGGESSLSTPRASMFTRGVLIDSSHDGLAFNASDVTNYHPHNRSSLMVGSTTSCRASGVSNEMKGVQPDDGNGPVATTLSLQGYTMADESFMEDESWRFNSDSDDNISGGEDDDDDFFVTEQVDEEGEGIYDIMTSLRQSFESEKGNYTSDADDDEDGDSVDVVGKGPAVRVSSERLQTGGWRQSSVDSDVCVRSRSTPDEGETLFQFDQLSASPHHKESIWSLSILQGIPFGTPLPESLHADTSDGQLATLVNPERWSPVLDMDMLDNKIMPQDFNASDNFKAIQHQEQQRFENDDVFPEEKSTLGEGRGDSSGDDDVLNRSLSSSSWKSQSMSGGEQRMWRGRGRMETIDSVSVDSVPTPSAVNRRNDITSKQRRQKQDQQQQLHYQQQLSPQRQQSASSSKQVVDLVYDSVLNSYYCLATGEYFQLA
eukprot:m.110147 g.110147  ORF g.110147 m.110147 type:complete len:713 (+) comp9217_c0_seq1:13-2151(+)